MLVSGKKFLVTGVLTEQSIAFSTARLLQEQGGEVVLTSFGRGMQLTERTARRLPVKPDVLELDVTQPGHLARLLPELSSRWDRLDGVLHAIAFAPGACLTDSMLTTQWADVALALEVSAFSLKSIAGAVAPLMGSGGSIVALDFDAGQAWPGYNWMGVAKAALESLARYLARDLGPRGIRVNLISAGPLSTVAARAIPLYADYERVWKARAPLGWDTTDTEAVGRACVALLSDWFPATTGEILHVDGGTHAVGAETEGRR
jgi:meromycolic acid enoyl-[acyl-carrier-protein] reductase